MNNPSSHLNPQATEYNTVGIDLGTTYSTVTYYAYEHRIENGKESHTDGSETPYIPSVVCNKDQLLVGTEAKKDRYRNRDCTLYDSKRFIGKHFNDASVQDLIGMYAFPIVEGVKGRAAFKVTWQGKEELVYPEQVYALIIKYLCDLVEKKTKRKIEFVVISVPVSFNADQRACTESAVKLSGRNLLAMIDEPSAAAISFTSRNVPDNKTILVYDLGGGTFDVSVMKKLPFEYKVLGVDGDSHFGGRNLDEIVFNQIVEKIRAQDPTFELTEASKEKISVACEGWKIELSVTKQNGSSFNLEIGGKLYDIPLGFTELEQLFLPLLQPTIEKVRSCLDTCHLMKDDIDYVIMIGGSSNWPGVARLIEQEFGNEKILSSDDPRLAVSRGTLIYASTRFDAGLVTPISEVRMFPNDLNAGMMIPVPDAGSSTRSTDRGLPEPFGDTIVVNAGVPGPAIDPNAGLVIPIEQVVTPVKGPIDAIDDEEEGESSGQKDLDGGTRIINSTAALPWKKNINMVRSTAQSNPESESSLIQTDSSIGSVVPSNPINNPSSIITMPPPPMPTFTYSMNLIPGTNYLKVTAKGQYIIQRNDTITWSHDLDGKDKEVIDTDRPNIIISNRFTVDLDGKEFEYKGKNISLWVLDHTLVLRSLDKVTQYEIPPPDPVPVPVPGLSSPERDFLSVSPSGQPFPPTIPTPPFIRPPINISPVLPLSIGIEVRSGKMSVIIPQNTPLPTSAEKMFQANPSSPTIIETNLYQGSNIDECKKNHELGTLSASNLQISPNGCAQIVVTVKVDVRGCVDFFYHQLGQKELRCSVYHNVVLEESQLEELKNKVDEWENENGLMKEHQLKYIDIALLLDKYKEQRGVDQVYAQWNEELRQMRVAVPSEVTKDLLQNMDILRSQLRNELHFSSEDNVSMPFSGHI